MSFLDAVWGWLVGAWTALGAFWSWAALVVFGALLTLFIRRGEKRWDEYRDARRKRKEEREAEEASQEKVEGWKDFYRAEAEPPAERFHLEPSDVDPLVWVLANKGPDDVRSLEVSLYPDGINRADNQSFELKTMKADTLQLVRFRQEAQTGHAVVALAWFDSSPTQQFQTIKL